MRDMESTTSGGELRALREEADLSQEHVSYAMRTSPARLRLVERADLVDPATVRRYQGAVALLVGLRRAVGRKVVRAAREAAAV